MKRLIFGLMAALCWISMYGCDSEENKASEPTQLSSVNLIGNGGFVEFVGLRSAVNGRFVTNDGNLRANRENFKTWEWFNLEYLSEDQVLISSLRDERAKYLALSGNGRIRFTENRGEAQGFNLKTMENGWVAFQSNDDQTYLSVKPAEDNLVLLGADSISTAELFSIIRLNQVVSAKPVALISIANNRYLSNDGKIVANRLKADDWERFSILTLQSGKVVLHSYRNDKYLRRQDNQELGFTDNLQEAETFDLENYSDDSVSFRSVNSPYFLSVALSQNSRLGLFASEVGLTERFRIESLLHYTPDYTRNRGLLYPSFGAYGNRLCAYYGYANSGGLIYPNLGGYYDGYFGTGNPCYLNSAGLVVPFLGT